MKITQKYALPTSLWPVEWMIDCSLKPNLRQLVGYIIQSALKLIDPKGISTITCT